jgi:hypothetical protein
MCYVHRSAIPKWNQETVVMLEDEVEIVLASQVEDWPDMCVIYPTADVHECVFEGLGVFSLQ